MPRIVLWTRRVAAVIHPSCRCRWLAMVIAGMAALACLSSPVDAHHPRPASGATGLVVPNLTHGEMLVVARHAGAIRNLAGSPFRTDQTFWRLKNFADSQRAFCLWLLVPGSIRDEESPFNECAHAYLAGLQALLDHMRTLPGAEAAAQQLFTSMQIEMIQNGAALQVCQYSDGGFRTGEVIKPDWRAVPLHLASAGSIGGVMLLVVALSGMMWWVRRR